MDAPAAGLLVALGVFLLVGWQGVTTVGRQRRRRRRRARRLRAVPGRTTADPAARGQNYEYSSPPLFAAVAVGSRATSSASAVGGARAARGTRSTRALWLALGRGRRRCPAPRASGRVRTVGGRPRARGPVGRSTRRLSLGRIEAWSAGQLVSLACGAGLIAVVGADRARGLARPSAAAGSRPARSSPPIPSSTG